MSKPNAASREFIPARKSLPLQWRGVRSWQKVAASRIRSVVPHLASVLLTAIVLWPATGRADEASDFHVDFRYSTPWWQSVICLPDDPEKTVVGKDGELLYDFPGKPDRFPKRIAVTLDVPTAWAKQELVSPRVPIVRTTSRWQKVEIRQEAFAATPTREQRSVPRYDIVLVRLRNGNDKAVTVTPMVTVQTQSPMAATANHQQVDVGDSTRVICSRPVAAVKTEKLKLVLRMESMALPAGGEQSFVVSITRGKPLVSGPTKVAEVKALKARAQRYWTDGRLPYDRIQIADAGIQALIDSSIRNIYQAREVKNGMLAFQVGPTMYRLLAVVDGSFLLETAEYLGRTEEARSGIRYVLSHQREDGGFTVFPKYWKESGIVLWIVTRHARLTGDTDWLREQWPRLERAFAFISRLREQASKDPQALYDRLIPPGMSDGGVRGDNAEYTNVYWTLVGMRSAIDAARWLGKTDEANQWQREYDDFYATFRKAAQRDRRKDSHGNNYLPIVMGNVGNQLPQCAQWAFCQAVFPGKLFASDDPLVCGNMAMLRATEREGMVVGTGWMTDGIWGYFASFYGHAWLWLGDGRKAAQSLYAFANHACPMLVWREEQKLRGEGGGNVGDMPHNWASAEFIRLVRHLMILERGNDLHLLEGMPAAWAKAGAVNRLTDMPTEFGPMSLRLGVSDDGRTARLCLDPPARTRPKHIFLHVGSWTGAADPKAVVELPVGGRIEKTIPLTAK